MSARIPSKTRVRTERIEPTSSAAGTDVGATAASGLRLCLVVVENPKLPGQVVTGIGWHVDPMFTLMAYRRLAPETTHRDLRH
jgi:hypothetical protein